VFVDSIRSFLLKHPHLHAWIQKVLGFIEAKFLGTRGREWYWATRHLHGKKTNTYWEAYSRSISHPHRKLLIDKIFSYQPKNVLEIGCNTGPNLFLLAKNANSTFNALGIDINPQAIKEGKNWLEKERVNNVELKCGLGDELEYLPDKSFDVVFSDATVIYIGPDKIARLIKNMLRIARKAIIFSEWNIEKSTNNKIPVFFDEMHWVYNYRLLVNNPDIEINPYPPGTFSSKGWEKYGAIVAFKL